MLGALSMPLYHFQTDFRSDSSDSAQSWLSILLRNNPGSQAELLMAFRGSGLFAEGTAGMSSFSLQGRAGSCRFCRQTMVSNMEL